MKGAYALWPLYMWPHFSQIPIYNFGYKKVTAFVTNGEKPRKTDEEGEW